jgi:hypothetical protein
VETYNPGVKKKTLWHACRDAVIKPKWWFGVKKEKKGKGKQLVASGDDTDGGGGGELGTHIKASDLEAADFNDGLKSGLKSGLMRGFGAAINFAKRAAGVAVRKLSSQKKHRWRPVLVPAFNESTASSAAAAFSSGGVEPGVMKPESELEVGAAEPELKAANTSDVLLWGVPASTKISPLGNVPGMHAKD